MKKIWVLKTFATALLVFASMMASAAANMADKNIVQVASSDREFSTLVKAIKAAGLADTLQGTGPFTVFAPTNAAFAKLPKGTLEKLLHNKQQLADILTYHVISGDIMSKNIQPGKVKTVQGGMVTISSHEGTLFVNNAKVEKADIKASNGVIHVINTVLMPPAAGPSSSQRGNK